MSTVSARARRFLTEIRTRHEQSAAGALMGCALITVKTHLGGTLTSCVQSRGIALKHTNLVFIEQLWVAHLSEFLLYAF